TKRYQSHGNCTCHYSFNHFHLNIPFIDNRKTSIITALALAHSESALISTRITLVSFPVLTGRL
ncbi:hypothetical protein, partial [Escherichia coli]|uniref:hypothetical protein n=1 Tax=Escherichia coli TaxID=562 RepID=UPI001BC962F3